MLLANHRENSEVGDAAKHVGSDIRTPRSITQILGQYFLPAV